MLCFYLSETRDTNLIDPIPAYAGMTGENMPAQYHTRMPTAFGGGCRAEHDGGWGG